MRLHDVNYSIEKKTSVFYGVVEETGNAVQGSKNKGIPNLNVGKRERFVYF